MFSHLLRKFPLTSINLPKSYKNYLKTKIKAKLISRMLLKHILSYECIGYDVPKKMQKPGPINI